MKVSHLVAWMVIATIASSLFGALATADGEVLTARRVMEKVDGRNDGDTAVSDMTMILIDKTDSRRRRQLKTYRKDEGKDTKSVIFFLSPADVRNTAYLSHDWDQADKQDDSWLYLPALRKVKRIAGTDESSAFMGSDFSYADINGLEIADWDYTFIKNEESLGGQAVWIIQGIPAAAKRQAVVKETGYLKVRMWVRKDNFMIVKGKYWVKKGKKIKYFRAGEIRQEGGIWTAFEMQMGTTRKGKKEHASVIKTREIVYNTDISDGMFSTQRMERGL